MNAYTAKLVISIGGLAKDYFSIMDKPKKYKRSRLKIRNGKGRIEVEIEANDATALIATLGSIVKQLSVIRKVDSLVEK
ncbi:MAG: KEOPS complex subunit Pcc1 [Candidatus Micrarchaeia archaeon]|jgi:tRNA threonylcarbamoyladenosine modification (KEOPS) complex  Pcc1 subunit